MNTIMSKLKSMRIGRNMLFLILMLVIGVASFFLLMFILGPFSPLSMYPAALLRMFIGFAFLMYMDQVHHSQIDTTQAIRDKNTAYAIIILSYAIIIASVLISI